MASTHKRELFGFLSINNVKHPLYTGHNLVGTNKEANIVISDISTRKQRALLTILDNKVYVSDLSSSNHTYIENTILTPLHLYEIGDQCVLKFGSVNATLNIRNIDQLQNHEALVKSQNDDYVSGVKAQFLSENTYEHTSTQIQTTRDSLEDQNTTTKSMKMQELTQLFWKTRKAFQPSDSSLPYNLVIIPNSDSSSDDDIKLKPTQHLDDHLDNNISAVNNNLNNENYCINESSQVNSGTRYFINQQMNNIDKNIVSVQEENLDNSQLSQPIRVKRKSFKQVLLSDSDTDLDDNEEVQLNKLSSSDYKSLDFTEILDRKVNVNSENIIQSLPKKGLKNRVGKRYEEDLASQNFDPNTKASELVLSTLVELKESANVQVNDSLQLIKFTNKSHEQLYSDNNDTDLEDNLDNDLGDILIKNSKFQLQDSEISDVLKENDECNIEVAESGNNNDLDNDRSNSNQQSLQVTSYIKNKTVNILTKSDSYTDLDDDFSNSVKITSGIKITETSNYSLNSDSGHSIEFIMNNTDLTEDANDLSESKLKEYPLMLKSSTQDETNDIIISSDDDTEVQNKIALKLGDIKINNPTRTNINVDIFGVDERLQITSKPRVNESLHTKDTTLYITSTRKSLAFNETFGSNNNDLSFIPATQDVAENIEISTMETQTFDLQETICQASFSLGISDYINHSQDEDKLTKKYEGKVMKKDIQRRLLREYQVDTLVHNSGVDELQDDHGLYLATTQPLLSQHSMKSDNATSLLVVDDDVDDIFLVPTPQINENNNGKTIESAVFVKPIRKIRVDGSELSDGEIDGRSSIFLAPTQQINLRHNDDNRVSDDDDIAENGIFTKPTQKTFRNDQEFLEMQKDKMDHVIGAKQSQEAIVLEQLNETGEDITKPFMTEEVPSQRKYENAKYLPKLQNTPIIDDEKTDREENPNSPISFKRIKVKRLSLKKNSDDNSKYLQKSYKALKEQEENTIDMTIFEQSTQRIEHNINDIFDVPTQVVDQPSDQPQKIKNNNTNNDLLITQNDEVIQEKHISVCTIHDLYDLQTQIISNNVEAKVLEYNLGMHHGKKKLQIETEISNIDNFVEYGSDYNQISNDDAVTKHQEGKLAISIVKEITIEATSCSTTDEAIPNHIQIKDDNVTTNQLDKTATSLENELITKTRSSTRSNKTKSQNKSMDANNKEGQLPNSLLNEVISSSRVTRQKFKELSAIASSTTLQHISKDNTTNISDCSEATVLEDTEENVDSIKLAVLNTKYNNSDNDKLPIEAIDKQPFFCTQEVLQVLISDTPSEDVQSEMSVKKSQFSEEQKPNDVEIYCPKVSMYSTQEVLDVLATGSSCTDKNQKNKSKSTSKDKGKKTSEHKVNDVHKIVKENVDRDFEVTSRVLDVAKSGSLVVSENRDKSKSIFIKPKNVSCLKPIKEKTSKRKIREQKKISIQGLLQRNDTQEIVSVVSPGCTHEENDYKGKIAFVGASENFMSTEITTRKMAKKKNDNSNRNIKIGIFSTQDVIDVLTVDDVEESNMMSKNRHVIEGNDYRSESVYTNDTKQLNANLQPTMIKANDKIEENQKGNDFEENRKIIVVPSRNNVITTRSCITDSNLNISMKVLPKLRKRVTIKDSALDEMHELPVKKVHSIIIQKPVAKKHKFLSIEVTDDDVGEVTNNSEMFSRKTRRLNNSTSESKTRSAKKSSEMFTRITRSTNEKIPITALQKDIVDTIGPIANKSRIREKQNNNNMDNAEFIINVASSSTDNTSVKGTLQGKRRRSNKNKDNEAVIKDTTGMLTAKNTTDRTKTTLQEKRTWSMKNMDIKPIQKDTGEISSSTKLTSRRESVSSLKIDAISETMVPLPLSQRTKRLLKPKIVFTMLNSPELESVIRTLGGLVVDSVEACSVLVTASVKRTEKLLTAIGHGKPICSDMWLRHCKTQNKFLDPWSHIFRDPEAETKWEFSLEVSLQRSRNKKLFENYTMMLIVNTAQDILKKAIEATGGKCVATARNTSKHFVIVSVPENKKKFHKYISSQSDVIIINPEGIFDAVLRQEIRFDMFKLA